MRHPKAFYCGILIGIFSLTFAHTIVGQSSLFDYGNSRFVRLELNKTIFSEAEDIGFLTLGNYLNAQYPLSGSLALIAEVPFALANYDGESEFALGNIGIGLNYFRPGSKFKGELYVGIPTASEKEAGFFGVFSDLTERISAYNTTSMPIRLMGNFLNYPEKGFIYRIRYGFELAVATDEDQDTELLFGLSALAGYAFSGGMVQGGLSTISIISESDLEFSERVIESFVLNGEFNVGSFRPGVVLRIPIDKDFREIVDLGIGLSLAVLF